MGTNDGHVFAIDNPVQIGVGAAGQSDQNGVAADGGVGGGMAYKTGN